MSVDINYLAELSSLAVSQEDIPSLKKEMTDILELIRHFPEDLPVEELVADESKVLTLRADTPGQSLTRDQALANAKEKQAGCIMVPQTV